MSSERRDLFEADLPEDLRLLAEQLSADAEHLAALYPAEGSAAWRSASEQAAAADRSSRGRIVIRTAAAAVALILVSCAWWLLPRGGSQTALETAEVAPLHSPAPLAAGPHRGNTARDPELPTQAPTVVPAGVFQTLTGAEQEALLDLIEQQDLGQASLSI